MFSGHNIYIIEEWLAEHQIRYLSFCLIFVYSKMSKDCQVGLSGPLIGLSWCHSNLTIQSTWTAWTTVGAELANKSRFWVGYKMAADRPSDEGYSAIPLECITSFKKFLFIFIHFRNNTWIHILEYLNSIVKAGAPFNSPQTPNPALMWQDPFLWTYKHNTGDVFSSRMAKYWGSFSAICWILLLFGIVIRKVHYPFCF